MPCHPSIYSVIRGFVKMSEYFICVRRVVHSKPNEIIEIGSNYCVLVTNHIITLSIQQNGFNVIVCSNSLSLSPTLCLFSKVIIFIENTTCTCWLLLHTKNGIHHSIWHLNWRQCSNVFLSMHIVYIFRSVYARVTRCTYEWHNKSKCNRRKGRAKSVQVATNHYYAKNVQTHRQTHTMLCKNQNSKGVRMASQSTSAAAHQTHI